MTSNTNGLDITLPAIILETMTQDINARRAQQSLYAIKGGIKGARGKEKEERNGEKVRGRRKDERRQSG